MAIKAVAGSLFLLKIHFQIAQDVAQLCPWTSASEGEVFLPIELH